MEGGNTLRPSVSIALAQALPLRGNVKELQPSGGKPAQCHAEAGGEHSVDTAERLLALGARGRQTGKQARRASPCYYFQTAVR